jgi:hypothetical protein
MAEEANISQEENWYYAKLAQRCLERLAKNNIPGYYYPDTKSACSKVLELIPPDATVGFGDSVTLYQVGIIAELEKRKSNLLLHPFYHSGIVRYPESRREVVKKGKEILDADYYLTGANAITMDGRIVNTDGIGNRVAGINKIVLDLEKALERIKTIAAPLNAHRHHLKHGLPPTPCSATGICSDCHLPSRICNYTVIVEYQPSQRIQVVLVGQKLGY